MTCVYHMCPVLAYHWHLHVYEARVCVAAVRCYCPAISMAILMTAPSESLMMQSHP